MKKIVLKLLPLIAGVGINGTGELGEGQIAVEPAARNLDESSYIWEDRGEVRLGRFGLHESQPIQERLADQKKLGQLELQSAIEDTAFASHARLQGARRYRRILISKRSPFEVYAYLVGENLVKAKRVKDIPLGEHLTVTLRSNIRTVRINIRSILDPYTGLAQLSETLLKSLAEVDSLVQDVYMSVGDLVLSAIYPRLESSNGIVHMVECQHNRFECIQPLGTFKLFALDAGQTEISVGSSINEVLINTNKQVSDFIAQIAIYANKYPSIAETMNYNIAPQYAAEQLRIYLGAVLEINAKENMVIRDGKLKKERDSGNETNSAQYILGANDTCLEFLSGVRKIDKGLRQATQAVRDNPQTPLMHLMHKAMEPLPLVRGYWFELTRDGVRLIPKDSSKLRLENFSLLDLLARDRAGYELLKLCFKYLGGSEWVFAAKFAPKPAAQPVSKIAEVREVAPVNDMIAVPATAPITAPQPTLREQLAHLLDVRNEIGGVDNDTDGRDVSVFKIGNINDSKIGMIRVMQDGTPNQKFTNFLHSLLRGTESVTLGMGQDYKYRFLQSFAAELDKQNGINVHWPVQCAAGLRVYIVSHKPDGAKNADLYFVRLNNPTLLLGRDEG